MFDRPQLPTGFPVVQHPQHPAGRAQPLTGWFGVCRTAGSKLEPPAPVEDPPTSGPLTTIGPSNLRAPWDGRREDSGGRPRPGYVHCPSLSSWSLTCPDLKRAAAPSFPSSGLSSSSYAPLPPPSSTSTQPQPSPPGHRRRLCEQCGDAHVGQRGAQGSGRGGTGLLLCSCRLRCFHRLLRVSGAFPSIFTMASCVMLTGSTAGRQSENGQGRRSPVMSHAFDRCWQLVGAPLITDPSPSRYDISESTTDTFLDGLDRRSALYRTADVSRNIFFLNRLKVR